MRRGARYAANTDVSSEASKAEIERTLKRYGATSFGYATDERERALVQFKACGRFVRFILIMPKRSEFYYRAAANQHAGMQRTPAEVDAAYEQAIRQSWRAMLLIIKAKLEAVEAKIVTFEDEFLPYTVLPNGETVAEWMQPQVDEAYKSGLMPTNLLALAPPKDLSNV